MIKSLVSDCCGAPSDPDICICSACKEHCEIIDEDEEDMKTGIELIAEERQRQIEVEGWSLHRDSSYTQGELAKAAVCYARVEGPNSMRWFGWPWSMEW